MDFRTLWLTTPTKARHAMVRKLGSSYKYLQKLSGHFAVPGGQLALRMVKLYPELTLDELLNVPKKIKAKSGVKRPGEAIGPVVKPAKKRARTR